jgi:hypothetical protein
VLTDIDAILCGARPRDITCFQGTKFQLLINLKAGAALSLAVPPLRLAQVDEVID